MYSLCKWTQGDILPCFLRQNYGIFLPMKSCIFWCRLLLLIFIFTNCKTPRSAVKGNEPKGRERISLNAGWKFFRYTSEPDKLIYDIRPEITDRDDNVVADT